MMMKGDAVLARVGVCSAMNKKKEKEKNLQEFF